jgi:hypothetical protein
MEEITRELGALNVLCKRASRDGREYAVTDWVFGYIVFRNGERIADGNFMACVSAVLEDVERVYLEGESK